MFNAHYLAYVDIALTELWRAAFGSYDSMVAAGFDVVVADVHAALPLRRPVRRGARHGAGDPAVRPDVDDDGVHGVGRLTGCASRARSSTCGSTRRRAPVPVLARRPRGPAAGPPEPGRTCALIAGTGTPDRAAKFRGGAAGGEATRASATIRRGDQRGQSGSSAPVVGMADGGGGAPRDRGDSVRRRRRGEGAAAAAVGHAGHDDHRLGGGGDLVAAGRPPTTRAVDLGRRRRRHRRPTRRRANWGRSRNADRSGSG